ncbi:phage portal protein [Amylibacter sp. SFDW26]|uniref:phage portal protein n=1 Tax=Amylibacter sp. SFDW26 TaxID=2652722 RepID=UPI001262A045|nr:phage portal protein [Amylibacter sp. SFDW26]KAB7616085.1 phage portal protein [Amylibacter sp. SFDW26]
MVLQFLRGKSPVSETKASGAAPVIAFHGAGRPAWSARDVASLTRTGFTGNPVGFRCVKMIAEAAAAVPWVLSDSERRYDQHPLLALLARPNGAQGRADLLESFYGQMLLSGDGYFEAAGSSLDGGPEELYVLRSDRMRVIPGGDGWPVAYEYSVGAKKHRFDMGADVAPICHVKAFHPQDDHYGLSPMQAAASALDVHNAASRWSKALLDNAARPSGAIVYKGLDGQGTLGSDQYNRLVDEIESNHQGARNAGRPMLLEGGLDWKPMGFSPSDMEFQKTKDSAAREVALAFGVPPMLLGLPGDNTYSNYQEANRAFYRLTVLPLVGKVADALSAWLSGHFGADLKLAADLDGVPALAHEREAQWNRVSGATFLSDTEKRVMLGLPAVAHE